MLGPGAVWEIEKMSANWRVGHPVMTLHRLQVHFGQHRVAAADRQQRQRREQARQLQIGVDHAGRSLGHAQIRLIGARMASTTGSGHRSKAVQDEGRREEQDRHQPRQALLAGLDDHRQRQRHGGRRGAVQDALDRGHLLEPEVEETHHHDQDDRHEAQPEHRRRRRREGHASSTRRRPPCSPDWRRAGSGTSSSRTGTPPRPSTASRRPALRVTTRTARRRTRRARCG